MSFQPPLAELYLQQKEYKTNQQTQRISTVRSQIKSEREINNSSGNRLGDIIVWGIERSGFFNGREKWAKGFENQRV